MKVLPAIAGLLILCGLLVLMPGCDGSDDDIRQLVVVSYGGAYQTAQRFAFFQSFEEEFGVDIREESYTGDLSDIRTMVESGDVRWDVVDVESPLLLRGTDEDLYLAVDRSELPESQLLEQAIHSHGVACCFWSTVLAYNTSVFSDPGSAPAGWQDFWDTDTFPGRRSLRNSPVGTLEIALMADGVDPESLYPLDVDRAFTSLDRIKDDVFIWWENGEQPANLLSNGDVVMASAYNGRIFAARENNAPVIEIWNQGLIDADWWVIPRGSENADIAQQFIVHASQAAYQAVLPEHIPYGPVNQQALDQLSSDVVRNLPTHPPNRAVQTYLNAEWWKENESTIEVRWNAWRAGG